MSCVPGRCVPPSLLHCLRMTQDRSQAVSLGKLRKTGARPGAQASHTHSRSLRPPRCCLRGREASLLNSTRPGPATRTPLPTAAPPGRALAGNEGRHQVQPRGRARGRATTARQIHKMLGQGEAKGGRGGRPGPGAGDGRVVLMRDDCKAREVQIRKPLPQTVPEYLACRTGLEYLACGTRLAALKKRTPAALGAHRTAGEGRGRPACRRASRCRQRTTTTPDGLGFHAAWPRARPCLRHHAAR